MSAKALGGLCLYGIIMTGSTAILAYLLTTSCGIDSEIKGSDNEVDNKIQKGLVNMDFSSSGKGSCEVWEGLGFRVFEWLCITIMTIVFAYWVVRKCTGKKGLIKKWKARKEKAKLEKIEKMKSTLRKQGLIVNEDVKTVEIDPIEQNPTEPQIKFYGKDTLPAV